MNGALFFTAVVILLRQIEGLNQAWENAPFFRYNKNRSGLPHFWRYSVCASDDGSIMAAALPEQGDFGGQIIGVWEIYISKNFGESWNLTFSTIPESLGHERKYDWNPMVCSASGQFMAIVKYDIYWSNVVSVLASSDFGTTFHPVISEFSYLDDSPEYGSSQNSNNIRHSMYVMNKQGDLILTRYGKKNKEIEKATKNNYFQLIKLPQNAISTAINSKKVLNFRDSVSLCSSYISFNFSMCELDLPPFKVSPFERFDDVRISMDRGGRIYMYQNSPTFVKSKYYPRFYSKPITRPYNDYPEHPHEVFRSSDSGDSWELLENVPRVNTVMFDKSGQYGIALHTMHRLNNPSAELYYSHDSGLTWLLSESAQRILKVGQTIRNFRYNGTVTSIIQHFNTGKSVIFTRDDGNVFISDNYGVTFTITTGAAVYKSDVVVERDHDDGHYTNFMKHGSYNSWPQLVSDMNGNHIVLIDLFQEKGNDTAAVLLAKAGNQHPLLRQPVFKEENDDIVAVDLLGFLNRNYHFHSIVNILCLLVLFAVVLYRCCFTRFFRSVDVKIN